MNRFPASKIWPGLRRQEQPKSEEPKVSKSHWLTHSDFSALFTFKKFVEGPDSGGYPEYLKPALKRLAEIGAVRSCGFGRYEITSFGSFVIDVEFAQAPALPLLTASDYNERKAREGAT
jgi:hypothetical protein